MSTDFFVSYTSIDRTWAEWIGWVLEEHGVSVQLQAWDFAPGSNFVLEMHRAATEAQRTLAVLSPDYLKSQFGAPEWAAAFAGDPQGFKRRLVPVRIRECRPEGLLAAVVYIDLVGKEEEDAQRRLIQGLQGTRAKPSLRPAFPGSEKRLQGRLHPIFPGNRSSAAAGNTPPRYMPNVRRTPSDLEKRRFVEHAFKVVTQHFEDALAELTTRHAGIEYDSKSVGPTKYTAELFIDGKSQGRCKIWLGAMLDNNSIAFSERDLDWGGDNSCNELLRLIPDRLAFVATMAMGLGVEQDGLDVRDLTSEGAAEYLWRRFASRVSC
jgi:hypothetical protein